jgi:hypothetical protein
VTVGTRSLRLLLLGLAVALLVPASALAAHRARHSPWQRPPIVVHLRWRTIANDVNNLVASGSFAAFDAGNDIAPTTLLDEQTGKETVFPACEAPLLGGGWLLMSCSQGTTSQLLLVTLATGRVQTVSLPAACTTASSCSPVAIGAYWFEVFVRQPGCVEHCTNTDLFQNLYTGRVENAPTGAWTIANLNSPNLAVKLCRSLRRPNFGSLTVYGRFAIYTTTPPTPETYLERCGSHQRLLIGNTAYLADNQRAVIWQIDGSDRSPLQGVLLPKLRRLRFTGLPRDGFFAALGTRAAYATVASREAPSSGYELLAATLPHALR